MEAPPIKLRYVVPLFLIIVVTFLLTAIPIEGEPEIGKRRCDWVNRGLDWVHGNEPKSGFTVKPFGVVCNGVIYSLLRRYGYVFGIFFAFPVSTVLLVGVIAWHHLKWQARLKEKRSLRIVCKTGEIPYAYVYVPPK